MEDKELRIIIAGGRDFKDYDLLSDVVSNYLTDVDWDDVDQTIKKVTFVSGGAKGADSLGEQFAYTYEYEVVRFSADWDKYGKSAGPRRNAEMAKYAAEKYGVLIAFWDGRSRGTKNMIDTAKRYGLAVKVVNYET